MSTTRRSLLTFLLALGLGVPLSAQRIRLNAQLDRVAVGDVLAVRVSAVGGFLVYSADQRNGGGASLFRAELEGSLPVIELAGGLTSFPPHTRFEIAPDGKTVVFQSERELSGRRELFAVPSDGSAPPQRLSVDLAPGGHVDGFQITPDARTVVYRADDEIDGRFQLWAVPIEGGDSVRVSAFRSRVESDFVVGPDATSVFFRALVFDDRVIELLRGSTDGAQPTTRLSARPVTGKDVEAFRVTPDGRAVVYRADERIDRQSELFAASSDGSTKPVLLSAIATPNGDVGGFELSSDGETVAYLADQEAPDVIELFSVPLTGGVPPRRLHAPLAAAEYVSAHAFGPDGKRVVFIVQRSFEAPDELFSSPADGSAPARKLDLDVLPENDVTSFQITPDGARVLYAKGVSLFGVPIDAREDVVLLSNRSRQAVPSADGRSVVIDENGALVSRRADGKGAPLALFKPDDLSEAAISTVADGLLLFSVHTSSLEESNTDLHRVPVDGSAAAVQVNPPFPLVRTVGDVVSFAVSARGNRAAFVTSGLEPRLFGVALDGVSEPVRLDSGPDDVYAALVSPDGERIAYQKANELFFTRMDGTESPVHVDLYVALLLITPDSRRVLLSGEDALYSALLDGTAPPIVLHETIGHVWSVRATPDSTRVVYTAAESGTGGLYAVPVDGSAPPLLLSSPRTTPGAIESFELSPDGRAVVFRSVDHASARVTLASVPLDGSAPPVVLATMPRESPPLGLRKYVIDAASAHVLYLFHHYDPGFGRGLFTVPIDGSASPLLLTPGATASAFQFELSADGARAAFLADARSSGAGIVHDVFAVHTDGSELPVQLNGAPAGYTSTWPGFSSVLGFGADRVVFHEVDRTVSTVLDGSARAILAEVPSNVVQLHLTPDGRSAVMMLPAPRGGAALFETALDGSSGLRAISGYPTAGGNVVRYSPAITADSSRVVYRGDLDEDGVDELYMSFLGRRARRAHEPEREATR